MSLVTWVWVSSNSAFSLLRSANSTSSSEKSNSNSINEVISKSFDRII